MTWPYSQQTATQLRLKPGTPRPKVQGFITVRNYDYLAASYHRYVDTQGPQSPPSHSFGFVHGFEIPSSSIV